MPWNIVHNHPACRAGEWAVVNQQAETEGRHSIEGCHGTRAEALAQQRALYANEPQAHSHEVQMMERKTLMAPVEWKATPGDPGTLDGYLSVFGNVDEGGDVVLPGAFKKTISLWQQSGRRIPLLVDHKLSTDGIIGSIDHASEDQVGLKVRARFSSIAKAQDIRTLMLEGHLNGMSFTYEPLKARPGTKDGQRVRFLEELRLFEGTVTPFPMNTLAMAGAKAALAAAEQDKASDATKPYGDVAYADPGYQDDGQKRYPLDTEAHCRAAWSYINQADNAAKYSADELALVKGRIRAALQRYGVQVSESASLDFDTFTTAMSKALTIEFEPARKAAVDHLVTAYHDSTAAGLAETVPSAASDAAPNTTSGPTAGGQPGSSVPEAQLTPREYVDDVLQRVEQADGSPASLDALEAKIRRSLGGAS